jgi:hypothetical protein
MRFDTTNLVHITVVRIERPHNTDTSTLLPSHRKKYEIATDEPHNPIKQDEKNGVPREVSPI